ncbi:MAG TPA: hypothetical protein VJJ83_00010 [Candidatus Babeliales bacterium]|nr:hypothetical protein [Candidatus Babeliales bacterium]
MKRLSLLIGFFSYLSIFTTVSSIRIPKHINITPGWQMLPCTPDGQACTPCPASGMVNGLYCTGVCGDSGCVSSYGLGLICNSAGWVCNEPLSAGQGVCGKDSDCATDLVCVPGAQGGTCTAPVTNAAGVKTVPVYQPPVLVVKLKKVSNI